MESLRQWYLKTFKKNEIVRVIFTGEDKRIHTKYVVPVGEVVEYKNMSFVMIPDLVYMLGGIPTIQVNYKSTELIDIYDTQKSKYTPAILNTALKANVVEQLYKANNKTKLDELLPILLIGVIAVMGYFIYTTGQNFTELFDRLTQIETIIGG
jgi:hypothetical protein